VAKRKEKKRKWKQRRRRKRQRELSRAWSRAREGRSPNPGYFFSERKVQATKEEGRDRLLDGFEVAENKTQF
jgi:hypothetical protein